MELELGKAAAAQLVASLEGHPNPRREIAACVDECNRLLNAIDHSEKDALQAFAATQEQQVRELKAHHVAKCLGHRRRAEAPSVIHLDAGPDHMVPALKSSITPELVAEAAAMTKAAIASPAATPAVSAKTMAALAVIATALAALAFLLLK